MDKTSTVVAWEPEVGDLFMVGPEYVPKRATLYLSSRGWISNKEVAFGLQMEMPNLSSLGERRDGEGV